MACCQGEGHKPLRQLRGSVDIEKLAEEVTNKIFKDVFEEGKRYGKSQHSYRHAATIGVGPKQAGEQAHRIVIQSAKGFLGSNEQLAEIAQQFGVDEVTQDHIDSIVNHPLNLINVPDDEHVEINKDYQRADRELEVSHLYEHVREQDYNEQMFKGLETLFDHSREYAWENYLDKVEYFGIQIPK